MQQILLHNATAILRQNATEVYYKMRKEIYCKCDILFYKLWQLLQNASILLQNAAVFTNRGIYHKMYRYNMH